MSVVETDPNDSQVATKVVIQDPCQDEDQADNLEYLDVLINKAGANKDNDGKKMLQGVMTAMLDLRKRLPPIFNLRPQNIIYNT